MHVTLWHYAMNAMTWYMTINEIPQQADVDGSVLMSLCAHAKCDLFHVVVLVILMFNLLSRVLSVWLVLQSIQMVNDWQFYKSNSGSVWKGISVFTCLHKRICYLYYYKFGLLYDNNNILKKKNIVLFVMWL